MYLVCKDKEVTEKTKLFNEERHAKDYVESLLPEEYEIIEIKPIWNYKVAEGGK